MLSLTCGIGAALTLGRAEEPFPPQDGLTDIAATSERLEHVLELRPEICTLDMGTMNFGDHDHVMVNTPHVLRAMVREIRDLGTRPELEIFDSGHLAFAKQLVAEGLVDEPVLLQLCMGIPWGAPNDLVSFSHLVSQIPEDWIFSAFSIGQAQFLYVAQAAIAGGNVRVGLEDNLYLRQRIKATNAMLVDHAVEILQTLGFNVMGPEDVRSKLRLTRPG